MDKLKKFIQKNNQEFDLKSPSQDLWNKIEKDIESEKPKVRLFKIRYWSAAASVILLLGFGYLIGKNSNPIENNNIAQAISAEKPISVLGEISDELGEIEHHYIHQVSQKLTMVKAFNPDEVLLEDYKDLEKELEELKLELGQNIDNEIIVEEMIENYRLKLGLLEHLLSQFESQKTNKNESRIQIIEL